MVTITWIVCWALALYWAAWALGLVYAMAMRGFDPQAAILATVHAAGAGAILALARVWTRK